VQARARGVALTPQPAFDATVPACAADLDEVAIVGGPFAGEALQRLATIGALMAAAEAVGAAGRLLEDACRYAGERRQFGRTIGSFQALRHLMADMYVRQASSWSSVLYAAAALDEDAAEAGRTASIAKAYVSRAAREVAHGAMQVFGGIAVTAEHPAHRFLRRIVVREQQFGDAAHHERALGRALAAGAVPEPVV
jgi:alkylation response protein AidB-like acyl-CoA dehydrogenase